MPYDETGAWVSGRIESGYVQFGDDWRAVVLRGDSAFSLAQSLKVLRNILSDEDVKKRHSHLLVELDSYIDFFSACNEHTNKDELVQELKDFGECLAG